jgi:hypothetical protein
VERQTPAWVTKTPAENTYQLAMFRNDDCENQSVMLTREEFIACKAHVATMRGYREDSTGNVSAAPVGL